MWRRHPQQVIEHRQAGERDEDQRKGESERQAEHQLQLVPGD